MRITQEQVDTFAAATGDHQWIYSDAQRAVSGPFKGIIAHDYLTLSLSPVVIAEVLRIRELTTPVNHGLNTVRFASPVRVGSQIRAAVSLISAQQTTAGVESVFELIYEVVGERRPVCIANVIVVYP
jgi:acyl dehydratase